MRAGAPVAPGPLVFGVSFGLLAQSAGMSPMAAIVMSATTFAGSAQFAAGSILMQGGGALAGSSLGDPKDYGLDAAFAALFLSLLRPYLRSRRALGAALLAAAVTLTLLPVALRLVDLLATMVVAGAAAALVRLLV